VVLQWSDAAVDCTAALAIDSGYVKAYMRRASAYEQSDDLERALADYKKVGKSAGRRLPASQAESAALHTHAAYVRVGAHAHPAPCVWFC
jgi:hypothetical protein